MDLISVSRRRRRKELVRVSLIVFLVSFFLAAVLLYHSQMEEYENQRNISCRGVNSPKVFLKYMEMLERQFGAKATKIKFKAMKAALHPPF